MAWYNTGTIALTNGSATVTGSGTNFLVGAQIGEALYAPDGKLYEIQTINSATVITLASNYLGSTASGQNYQIIPTQSLVADLASDVTDLISDFANVRDYAGNGKFNDGAVGTPGITFTQDQDNGLYRIGSNNWALAAGGQQVVNLTTTAMNFPDNNKAIFGTGSDLQIYHDGSDSYVKDAGVGYLNLLGTGRVVVGHPSNGDVYLNANYGGDVELFFNNSKKFETTATGIDVTGTVTAESLGIGTSLPSQLLELSGATAPAIRLNDTTYNQYAEISTANAGSLILKADVGNGGTGDTYIGFEVDTTEAMRIDASGNVRIGVSGTTTVTGLTQTNLIVGSTTGGEIVAYRDDNAGVEGDFVGAFLFGNDDNSGTEDHFAGMYGKIVGTAGNSMSLNFASGLGNYETDTPQMVLDASGNLLVGKTATSFSLAGIGLMGNDQILATAASDNPLALNRLTTDGDIARLYKDSVQVGSIGVVSGNNLNIFSAVSGHSGLSFGTGIVYATDNAGDATDNVTDLGSASFRWNDAYITNGVTTGSDGNDKQDIETLSDAEQRVAVACKGLLRKWRWKSAVEEKGDEARIHFGIIAQDLQAAFEAEGLDAGRYALFMSNTWTDEETGEERTRLGVRYHELLAFIIAAI